MSLPILVIDDQLARDASERALFLREVAPLNAVESSIRFEMEFCTGQRFSETRIVNDYEVIRQAVYRRKDEWSLVLLDVRFDSGPLDHGLPIGVAGDDHFGEEVAVRLAKDVPGLPLVMLSQKGQHALNDVGLPYISKKRLDNHRLTQCLLRHGRLTKEQVSQLLGLKEVVAEAPATRRIFQEAFVHAPSDVSILIQGETGSGKEVVARYVHQRSQRSEQPFVAVNVAAIPQELLEAELFGTARGAATGVSAKKGFFEQANGGTLFLDEIGELPLDSQVKLLRVLQERVLFRVGSREPVALDIRLVCATSRNLASMVASADFRADLYYRIDTVELTLPPLRERQEDIPALARLFLSQSMEETGKEGISFTPEALDRLRENRYPGNVRQLQNHVRRLVSQVGDHQLIDAMAVANQDEYAVSLDVGVNVEASQSLPATKQDLESVVDILAGVSIVNDPEVLRGIYPRLQAQYKLLLRRLAGACLQCCRDPMTGKVNRQRAMQLFSSDPGIKGKEPARMINRILERPLNHPITESDLTNLISCWEASGEKNDQ